MPALSNHSYRFGEFTLDAVQKVLLREGKPLLLAPKVVETLLTLVQNSGRIIEKEELMMRLWPDTYVEESNLTYTIVQLRKTLGDDARHPRYIETIPRRGYRFMVEVEESRPMASIAVLPFLDLSPESYLDPLRNLPRFQELLRVQPALHEKCLVARVSLFCPPCLCASVSFLFGKLTTTEAPRHREEFRLTFRAKPVQPNHRRGN